MRARLNAMPDLEMLIYNGTNGIETTIGWKTEQHYQAAAAFLKKLLHETDVRAREPGRLEFYFIDTQEQMDALWGFARALTKPPT
jgi:hypothetical protein